MAYRRVARDPNEPLLAGNYELVSVVESGNPDSLTRADLERALRARYPRVTVTDYGRNQRGELIVRFAVTADTASRNDLAPMWLPAVITGAAIMTTLWLIWRIATRLVELVELVGENPGVQVGLGSLGIGLVLLGGALLIWVISPMKGADHERTTAAPS